MRTTARQKGRSSKAGGLNTSALEIFRVLTSFISRDRTCGVTELAKELGLTKNLAFRTLSTLVDEGYLVRDASGARYELGYRVLDFRSFDAPKNDIRSLCTEYLQRMQELTGESVMLALPLGLRVVTVDGVESFGRRYSRISWGFAPPLHAGAAARVILASLTDNEIRKYLEIASPLRRFTENTIVTAEKLWEEVGKVRARGYAIGLQDLTFGSNYVSFAILDINDRPHGALTIGGPLDRFSPAVVDRTIEQMKAIVFELNQRSRLLVATPFFVSN